MHDDDGMVGRLLTRRELVALFGLSGVASVVHPLFGQAQGALPVAPAPGCIVQPQQTEGPYFVEEQLNRSDIRPDPGTGTAKPGTPLDLAFRISEVASDGTCRPLAGAQVDVWHCDAAGVYSDVRDNSFNTVGQKFLRGHQVTDAAGAVQFVTIYPGWYPGRAVHIHFKVRTNPAGTQGYEFTSQLYFDEALTDRVFSGEPYAAHRGSRMRNERDGIYRQGGSELMLAVAPQGERYAATFTLGMRPGDPPVDDGFGRGRGRRPGRGRG
jgi:protocatechuate 3,4-dioxygenase beta subunit